MVENGGLSASGHHLGWPHFPFPPYWMRSLPREVTSQETENEVIPDGDRKRKGRHFPPSTIHHHGVPKTHPVFWMTSVGRSDSLKTSYRRLPPPWLITTWSHMFFRDTLKYVLMTSDSFFWGFWKHLIVSLTQALSKWLSKLPACYYGEVISLHLSTPCPMENCYPWDMVLTSASTYSTFFFFFFNCTLQYSRFIEEYSVIVGRNLVWLETNFTPTMTILGFPRFYRPSHNDRTVRVWGQFGSVRLVRCLGCRSQSIVIHDFYSRHVQP